MEVGGTWQANHSSATFDARWFLRDTLDDWMRTWSTVTTSSHTDAVHTHIAAVAAAADAAAVDVTVTVTEMSLNVWWVIVIVSP